MSDDRDSVTADLQTMLLLCPWRRAAGRREIKRSQSESSGGGWWSKGSAALPPAVRAAVRCSSSGTVLPPPPAPALTGSGRRAALQPSAGRLSPRVRLCGKDFHKGDHDSAGFRSQGAEMDVNVFVQVFVIPSPPTPHDMVLIF